MRILVLLLGLVGALFYFVSLVTWFGTPGARRDGFELIGIALSTMYFGVLVLPALIVAATGRWLATGLLLGLVAVAFATDAAWAWIPWP